MGDLLGHVLPGTFFAAIALWWTWSIFHRYYVCKIEKIKNQNVIQYKNTLCFPCTLCSSSIPVEGMTKASFAFIGIIGEFLSFCIKSNFNGLNQPQHMLMYTFFGLSGIVDVLTHYRFPIPSDSDYVMGLMALVMEGFLFTYHLHERSPLDSQIHVFLAYAIFGTVLAGALEMKYRHNILPALMRTYFTLLQGTWFYQVGFILYPLIGMPWEENHASMMNSTVVFGFHNLAVLFFLSISGAVIYHRVKRLSENDKRPILLPILDFDSFKYKSNLEDASQSLLDSEEEIVTVP